MQDYAMVIQVHINTSIIHKEYIYLHFNYSTLLGSPLLFKSSDTSNEYYLNGVLNRILNAYDPDPDNGSCPFHESNLTSFINSFVKPSAHIEWIMNATQLSLAALTDPVTSANDGNTFAASTTSATTTTVASLLLRASCFGIDWAFFLLIGSLFILI